MVARSREEEPDQPPGAAPPSYDAPPAYSRYAHPLDPNLGGIEGHGAGARMVPVFHESFQRQPRLRPAARKELMIKQGALRIAAGLELRSLRVLAKAIGCSHTALDKAVAKVCERIGMRKFHVTDQTRMRMRAARLRQLAKG